MVFCLIFPENLVAKAIPAVRCCFWYLYKQFNKIIRALLIFFLGWIGSVIINHSGLKPEGWTSRSWLIALIPFGIFQLIAVVGAFLFDPAKESNIGYKKD